MELCWWLGCARTALLLTLVWPGCGEPLPLRDVDTFLNPVFVPDFFLDLAGSQVLDALVAPRHGGRYTGSVLDEVVSAGPRMAPVLLWQCGLWKALSLGGAEVSQIIVDVGAHEWSRFLPELRRDPKAWLVLVEPGRSAFLELYRRLKVDYSDVLDRVVALPVALTWEEGLKWGFRALHTNDFLGGECNSLLVPDESFGHPCTAKGPEVLVPVTSLDVLLHGLMLGTATPSEESLLEYQEALKEGPPIKLKLDAQGADVDILSALATASSPLARVILERIEEVQIEVSEPVYENQPSRHETITRMHQLGYQADWQREEVQDGGTHQVFLGCRLVATVPLTEDCFFRRSSWAHGRVLDHVLRRPEEILRISEGSELSISSQYSHYMKLHVDECSKDETLAKLSAETGSPLACLYGISGRPLRHLFHSILALWELMWSSKQGRDESVLVNYYTQVLDTIRHILMLDSETPNAWEQLHDVGAAHLVFVVLVEATCLAFPQACPTQCREDDVVKAPVLAGRPSPCVTLGNCYDLLKGASFEDLARNPEKNVFDDEKKLCSGRSRELRHSHEGVKTELAKSDAELAQANIEIDTMSTKIEEHQLESYLRRPGHACSRGTQTSHRTKHAARSAAFHPPQRGQEVK